MSCSGKGNLRVYVLSTSLTPAPGKVGVDGKYPEELGCISYAATPFRSGDIYLVGSSYYCSAFGDRFESFDAKDNVDGSENPDMLPDFAGETLVSICDDSVFAGDSLGRIAPVAFNLINIAHLCDDSIL